MFSNSKDEDQVFLESNWKNLELKGSVFFLHII